MRVTVRARQLPLLMLLAIVLFGSPALPWSNGPSGNASTNQAAECVSPPYGTHDWIADHAMALLPDEEKAWLAPHKRLYLLGTEAPDNRNIPDACGAPNNGYDDRSSGHSVEWSNDWSEMVNDRAARRAREEYNKAVAAFQAGDRAAAAYYLGAMAHYIGDVSQYGHCVPFETHHGDYESWVTARTESFAAGTFEAYVAMDSLTRRTPYTAVKLISKDTARGRGTILSASQMDALYPERNSNQQYRDSVGHSLDLGANTLADLLHTFYLNVVSEEE